MAKKGNGIIECPKQLFSAMVSYVAELSEGGNNQIISKELLKKILAITSSRGDNVDGNIIYICFGENEKRLREEFKELAKKISISFGQIAEQI